MEMFSLKVNGLHSGHGFRLTSVNTQGERFTAVGNVPNKDELERDPKVCTFYGKGRTLMSGMGDAHTHLSWNGGDLIRLGELDVEEHTLLTTKSAQCYLDSGYTMSATLSLLFTVLFMLTKWHQGAGAQLLQKID